VIEEIEDFRPELNPLLLRQRKILAQREIDRGKTRRNQGISTEGAEKSSRWGRKLTGVEVEIRPA
jgi:hypothetical protein